MNAFSKDGGHLGDVSAYYITLGDLLASDTAVKMSIDNTPDADQLANLENLVELANKLYMTVGPFQITSGFRSKKLNEEVGGAPTSFHLNGMAMDIMPLPRGTATEYYFKILKSPIAKEFGEVAIDLKNNPPTRLHLSAGQNYGGKPLIALKAEPGKGYIPITEQEMQDGFKQFGLVGWVGTFTVLTGMFAMAIWYAQKKGYLDEWLGKLREARA